MRRASPVLGPSVSRSRFGPEPRLVGFQAADGGDVNAEFRESGMGNVLVARVVPAIEIESNTAVNVVHISNITQTADARTKIKGYSPVAPHEALEENARRFSPVYEGLERLVLAAYLSWDLGSKPRCFGVHAVEILGFHLALLFFYLDGRVMKAASGAAVALQPVTESKTGALATRPDHIIAYYGAHEGLDTCTTDEDFAKFSVRFEKSSGDSRFERLAEEAVQMLRPHKPGAKHIPMGGFLARYLSLAMYRLETRLPGICELKTSPGASLWASVVARVRGFTKTLHTSGTLFERRLMTAHPWSESTLKLTSAAAAAAGAGDSKKKRPLKSALTLVETSKHFMGLKSPAPLIRGPQRATTPALYLPYFLSSPYLLDQLAFFVADHSEVLRTDATVTRPWLVCAWRTLKSASHAELITGEEWAAMSTLERAAITPLQHSALGGVNQLAVPFEAVVEAVALCRQCTPKAKTVQPPSKRRKKEAKKKEGEEEEGGEDKEDQEQETAPAEENEQDLEDEKTGLEEADGDLFPLSQSVREGIEMRDALSRKAGDEKKKPISYECKFPTNENVRTRRLRSVFMAKIKQYTPWSLGRHTGLDRTQSRCAIGTIVAVLCQTQSNTSKRKFLKALFGALRTYVSVLLCSSSPRSAPAAVLPLSLSSSSSRKRKPAALRESAVPASKQDGSQVRERLQSVLAEHGLAEHACFVRPLFHNVCALNCPVVLTGHDSGVMFYYADVPWDGRFAPDLSFSDARDILRATSAPVKELAVIADARPLPGDRFLVEVDEPKVDHLSLPLASAAASSSSSSAAAAPPPPSPKAKTQSDRKKECFCFTASNLWGYLREDKGQEIRLLPVSAADFASEKESYESAAGFQLIPEWTGRRSGCRLLISERWADTAPPTDFELDLIDRQMHEPYICGDQLFESFLLLFAITGSAWHAHCELQWAMKIKRAALSSERYCALFRLSQEAFYSSHLQRFPQDSAQLIIQSLAESQQTVTYQQIRRAMGAAPSSSSSSSASASSSSASSTDMNGDEFPFLVSACIIAAGRTQLTSSVKERRIDSQLAFAKEKALRLADETSQYLATEAVCTTLYQCLCGNEKARETAKDIEAAATMLRGKVQVPVTVSVLLSLKRAATTRLRDVPGVENHIKAFTPDLIKQSHEALMARGLTAESAEHKQTARDILHSMVQNAFGAASGPTPSHTKLISDQLYYALVAALERNALQTQRLLLNTPRTDYDRIVLEAKRNID